MRVSGTSIEQVEKGKPRKRCTRWRLWVSTDVGRKSRRIKGTYTEAQAALAAFVDELSGLVVDEETFAACAESWRRWRAESGDYAPGTCQNDARCVRALARSPLGGMRMDAITPGDCRNALTWVKINPARSDKPLSGTSMNKIHCVLADIMRSAYRDGRLARDPMEFVKPPKVDTKEREALSPEELTLLLNRLAGLRMDGRVMALYLIALLGLRRAEACALLDEDVRDGMAHIHLAVKERDGTVGEPKSKAGVRTLPVPPPLQLVIDEWRVERWSRGYGDAPTLACNTKGGVLRPQLLQRWWDKEKAGIGCEGMTLHQLRHSNLSMMARHMSPFDLQRWAGWSSIEPAKVYIHEDAAMLSRAVTEAWPAAPIPHHK